MVKIGVEVRVLSFCLELISINSVLVIFSVSLFAISQSLMFCKSSLRQVLMAFTSLSAYVRCVSSAYILG